MWITPSERSVTRGEEDALYPPELRRSSTRYGVVGVWEIPIAPSYATLTRGYPHCTPTA